VGCVGTLVGALVAPNAGQQSHGFVGRIAGILPKARTLCALLAMVVIGGLVGVSSIVAVPYLRELAEATKEEKETFKIRLVDYSFTFDKYAARFPDNLASQLS
jgi:hypothetical protein